jgi:uncharacterized caspase-like protein
MKTPLSRIIVVAAVTVATIGCSLDAFAERRVALVVGNAAYKAASLSLANPRNDAEDISAALKGLGFDVVTTINATKHDMDLAMQQFARLATGADSALFFYAGHAMQFQGRNYLMPTDAELEDEVSVRFQMVGLDDVRATLDRTGGVKIMILDACRNNPLAARLQSSVAGASRSAPATRGLAPMDRTRGMVVAYATAVDDVAQDGSGRNSPFTTALLKRLQEPGLEIEMMFRRVASDVNNETSGRQRPETSISLLSEYYLNQNDRLAWDRIKDQNDAAALRDFVTRYPSSPLAITARNRLDLLDEARRAREDERRKAAEAEAQRAAEEQKRQDALRQQQDEQKRQDALRQQQDEQKRQDALRQQQEEQKRQDALAHQREDSPANVRPAPAVSSSPIPPARANLPEQIRQAQTELKRLGCFGGSPDGQLNDATRNAVKALWHYTRKPAVEINVTDGFIADLKRQPSGVCAPPARPAPPVALRPSPAGPPRNAADAAPPRPVTPPAATQPESARATAASPPAMGTGGF